MDDELSGTDRAIKLILNLLLIAGAILCVLTIDGGRWLTSNPALYDANESGLVMDVRPAVIPATGGQAQNCPPAQNQAAVPAQAAPAAAALLDAPRAAKVVSPICGN